MNRVDFLQRLARAFYPILRAEGFKGSGTALRRVVGPFHHIVNIQGSNSASGCYVNLGAHPGFLPAEGGGAFSPPTFDEPACAFRTRIDPPSGKQWPYGASEAEASHSIDALIARWAEQGHAFFLEFSAAPGCLDALVARGEADTCPAGAGLTASRIALHLEQCERAVSIASASMEKARPAASSLRAELKNVLDRAAARAGPP